VYSLRYYKWVLRQYLKLGSKDLFQYSLQCTEDSTTEWHVAIAEKFVKYIMKSFSFIVESIHRQQPVLRKNACAWLPGSQRLGSGWPEFDFQKRQGFFPSSPYLIRICENSPLYPTGVWPGCETCNVCKSSAIKIKAWRITSIYPYVCLELFLDLKDTVFSSTVYVP
jgi:hypothetical protein